jgi:SAM-dependent methyltransferase
MPYLQMGTPEQFATLREHFLQSGFTQEILRHKLDIEEGLAMDLARIAGRPSPTHRPANNLDALIYLLVLGEPISANEAASFFPPAVWHALQQTRIVVADTVDANRFVAGVALYPIRDLFLASDRWTNPDHSQREMFPDIVYPALTKSGKQFIDYTSFAPCEDFLELCAGSAPAALLAARSAKNVWATDIAERSLDFARFNAALNGIHNVTFARGDLYQSVGGRTFDRIAAHPPYVPVLKPAEIFYGGGEVGEEITKRVFVELPSRLKLGGRLYCRTMGTERPGKSFETRIREWLGDAHTEFDVALFALQNLEPRQFALEETLNKNGGMDQFAEWAKLFAKHNVHELVVGIVVVQRHTERRPAFTIRRTIGSNTPAAAIERAMLWESQMQGEGAFQKLLLAKPVPNPGIEIIARHVLQNGEISALSFTLSIASPFATDGKVQPWMALLLPRCDGKTTVADLFETAKQSGWIVPDTPAEEFSRLLGTLISGGFLQTEDSRLPAAAG